MIEYRERSINRVKSRFANRVINSKRQLCMYCKSLLSNDIQNVLGVFEEYIFRYCTLPKGSILVSLGSRSLKRRFWMAPESDPIDAALYP